MFDSILINFQEGKDDEVILRAFCAGGAERRFSVPLEVMRAKDFISHAYQIFQTSGEKPNALSTFACPVCKNRKSQYHKIYRDKRYCGLCGAHYKLVDGEAVLIARTDQNNMV
jgi:uncharacterized protein YbaR (Trm112 family)